MHCWENLERFSITVGEGGKWVDSFCLCCQCHCGRLLNLLYLGNDSSANPSWKKPGSEACSHSSVCAVGYDYEATEAESWPPHWAVTVGISLTWSRGRLSKNLVLLAFLCQSAEQAFLVRKKNYSECRIECSQWCGSVFHWCECLHKRTFLLSHWKCRMATGRRPDVKYHFGIISK